jgi:hypothetical protein
MKPNKPVWPKGSSPRSSLDSQPMWRISENQMNKRRFQEEETRDLLESTDLTLPKPSLASVSARVSGETKVSRTKDHLSFQRKR